MTICEKCGAENPDETTFCLNCGELVAKKENQEAEKRAAVIDERNKASKQAGKRAGLSGAIVFFILGALCLSLSAFCINSEYDTAGFGLFMGLIGGGNVILGAIFLKGILEKK